MPLPAPKATNNISVGRRKRGWRWLFRYGVIGGLTALGQFVAQSARRSAHNVAEWYRDGQQSAERRRRARVLLELEMFEERNPPSDMLFSNGLSVIGTGLLQVGFEGYEPRVPTENEPGDIKSWLSAPMLAYREPLPQYEPRTASLAVADSASNTGAVYQRWQDDNSGASFLGTVGEAGSWSRLPEIESGAPVDSTHRSDSGGGGGGGSGGGSGDAATSQFAGQMQQQSAHGEWSNLENSSSANNPYTSTDTSTATSGSAAKTVATATSQVLTVSKAVSASASTSTANTSPAKAVTTTTAATPATTPSSQASTGSSASTISNTTSAAAKTAASSADATSGSRTKWAGETGQIGRAHV
jgi:hypothetical protein